MSKSPDDNKIAIAGEVRESVLATLNGSVLRMQALANSISLKRSGDAHEILQKSRLRIARAMKRFETTARAGGVRHKADCIAVVSLMAVAYNSLDSGIDALEEGELTKNDLMEVAKDTRSAVIQARTLIKTTTVPTGPIEDAADAFLRQAEAAAPRGKKSVDEHQEDIRRSSLRRLEQQRDARQREVEEEEQRKLDRKYDNQDKFYDRIGDLFKSNTVHLMKLPSAKVASDPFVLLKLPVFPITESPIDKKYFVNAGMKVKEAGKGILIIEDQILLGINTASLKKDKVKLSARAKEIIKIMSQKRHTVYHVMGSDGADIKDCGRAATNASPGFVYYWLVEDKVLTRLNTSLSRNNITFDLSDWGLALPSVPKPKTNKKVKK